MSEVAEVTPTDQNHIQALAIHISFRPITCLLLMFTSSVQSLGAGSQKGMSPAMARFWLSLQILFWALGAFLFFSLLYFPDLGLLLFWNVLIPVAPALLVVATGLWRNVCPLATTTLLPRHLGLSAKKIMPVEWQGKLSLLAVIALYLIVPLRHAIFNTNGQATAVLLFLCALTGISMGLVFDWKSGWCSTLCPVSPVEKLYGENTWMSMPNAHCKECVNCSIPCPDSTPNFHPALSKKTIYHRLSSLLLVGGLPGFIWGWFHVPDHEGIENLMVMLSVYEYPLIGTLVSLFLFLLIKPFTPAHWERKLVGTFAASAVSCYYWYRIPALFGFGRFAKDGLLIDLSTALHHQTITWICVGVTVFFFWWLVWRTPNKRSWSIRPAFKA